MVIDPVGTILIGSANVYLDPPNGGTDPCQLHPHRDSRSINPSLKGVDGDPVSSSSNLSTGGN